MKVLAAGLLGFGLVVAATDYVAAQDVTKGKAVFNQCMLCHRVGPDATVLIGPVLNNVIGRQAGSYPNFHYSPLMKAAGDNGLVWSEDLIIQYIADPTAFLTKFLTDKDKTNLATGTSLMTFRLMDEQQRKDVAAYEATFSEKK